MARSGFIDAAVRRYIAEHAVRDAPVLAELRARTAREPHAGMQVSPDQGQLLALLVQLMGARRCLEIGTFTGYSALCIAAALPADGRLVCLDVNAATTAIAQEFWMRAGVAQRIDLVLGPALATLDSMLEEGEAATFDFAFIDADKPNYLAYYERCLKLLRTGGLVAIDNVLWGGSVADPADGSESTQAIRALNDFVHRDERVSMAMLPVGDGLTLAVRR